MAAEVRERTRHRQDRLVAAHAGEALALAHRVGQLLAVARGQHVVIAIDVSLRPAGAATQMTEVIRTDERFKEKYLDRIPMGRWAEPDEIAPVFVFFASDASAYVTGQVLAVNGGLYM